MAANDGLSADPAPARRWVVWVVHLAILAGLLALDGPFARLYVPLKRRVSDSVTDHVLSAPGKPGLTVVVQVQENGAVVEERRLQPADGGKLRILAVSYRARARLLDLLDAAASADYVDVLQQMGVFYTGLVVMAFMWIYDRPKRPFLLIPVAAAVACSAVVSLLQHTVGRLRPDEVSLFPVYLPLLQGWLQSSNLSFPSGHATYAFVLATFLSRAYPRASGLFCALAAGCGLVRLLTLKHWPSDVYAGALLGYAVTAWMFRWLVRNEARVLPRLPGWLRARVADDSGRFPGGEGPG